MARNQQFMALNKLGIDKFHELIEDRIKGNTNFSVDGIVSNSDYVDLTPFKTVIDLDKKFEDRYHLAKYLYETLVNEYSENRGEYGMDNRDEHGKSVGLLLVIIEEKPCRSRQDLSIGKQVCKTFKLRIHHN